VYLIAFGWRRIVLAFQFVVSGRSSEASIPLAGGGRAAVCIRSGAKRANQPPPSVHLRCKCWSGQAHAYVHHYKTIRMSTLTRQNRDSLEKLLVAVLLKRFPTFCWIPEFITVLTEARHWSLFPARWIKSIYSHCFLKIRGGWYVFGFIKKTRSYGIEKNVFTLHIPLWAPHTLMTSLF
jgi:hypothetical protein